MTPRPTWEDAVVPIGPVDDPEQTVVIDDSGRPRPPTRSSVPALAAARTRLGLTVDQLAERTRIRPHVIESIEVDDFAPCGGDFYARGHLRTLARVLGVDAAPLLASYDEHYADAPIDPRRVFEAELATGVGGSIRGTRGGPNWSVLVAAVMAVVLVWSIARLVDGRPGRARTERRSSTARRRHAGQGSRRRRPEVPVVLTAAGGGAQRHGARRPRRRGLRRRPRLRADRQTSTCPRRSASGPVDGSVTAAIDGEDRGPLGETGRQTGLRTRSSRR